MWFGDQCGAPIMLHFIVKIMFFLVIQKQCPFDVGELYQFSGIALVMGDGYKQCGRFDEFYPEVCDCGVHAMVLINREYNSGFLSW